MPEPDTEQEWPPEPELLPVKELDLELELDPIVPVPVSHFMRWLGYGWSEM